MLQLKRRFEQHWSRAQIFISVPLVSVCVCLLLLIELSFSSLALGFFCNVRFDLTVATDLFSD